MLKLLFTLISVHLIFYPAYAISRELTTREKLTMQLVIGRCLFEEGYTTKEDAAKTALKGLREDGLTSERLLTLMEDKDLEKSIVNTIQTLGGCKAIGKDYEKWLKENSK